MKNSLIIIGTFFLISILIIVGQSQIKAYPFGDNSKLSIDTINQLLDLQVDSDKGDSSSDKGDSSSDIGDSSSDKGDSSSDKGSVGSNDGSKNNIENSNLDFFGNPSLVEDNGNKNGENKDKSDANSPRFRY